MKNQAIKQNLKVASYMFSGALLLAVFGFSIWATMNADVLVKAVRYPEAVRQMKIEVHVAQTQAATTSAVVTR